MLLSLLISVKMPTIGGKKIISSSAELSMIFLFLLFGSGFLDPTLSNLHQWAFRFVMLVMFGILTIKALTLSFLLLYIIYHNKNSNRSLVQTTCWTKKKFMIVNNSLSFLKTTLNDYDKDRITNMHNIFSMISP